MYLRYNTTIPILIQTLKADTGDVVLINDHSKLPDQTYSIYHRPGSDPRDFVADGKVDLESDNVFLITVVFQDPAGNYTWQLGIWNNDTGASRDFTWVVSATLANTAQPWIDVEPTIRSWDILVNNKGTGPFTVNSVSPAFPAGFALGPLPVSLNPGGSAPLTVTFSGSGNSPGSNGGVTATTNLAITPADGTAGTSAGHNRQLSVSATDDLTVRTLTLKRDGVDPTLWPQLSCSQANEISLKDSSLRLDPNREVRFQGDGSMRSAGDMRFLTGAPAATEKVRVLANGNVGIGTSAPNRPLTVQAQGGSQELIGFKDPTGATKWHINQNLGGSNPGLNFVETGVADARLFLKAGGNVGIGTTTPGFKLDVNARIRLRQGGDSSAGLWLFQTTPNSDRAFVGMASDNQVGFWGNTGAQWGLVMDTTTGNVGIGTTSPGFKLDVNTRIRLRQGADFSAGLWLFQTTPNREQAFVGMATDTQVGLWGNTGAQWGLVMDTSSGNVGIGIGTAHSPQKLDVGGAVHASSFPTSSDKRFKTNIVPLTDALKKIDGIHGVVFNWNELYESLGRSTGRREIGVIAQDVEEVFPELVSTWHEEGCKAVDYGRLTAVLVEATKELKAKNETLERRLDALEKLSIRQGRDHPRVHGLPLPSG